MIITDYLIMFSQTTQIFARSILKIKDFTYRSKVLKVVRLMTQHCKRGAKIDISSWKGFPKPLPWSKCNVKLSFPKILNVS